MRMSWNSLQPQSRTCRLKTRYTSFRAGWNCSRCWDTV